jgi:hypothetical protein
VCNRQEINSAPRLPGEKFTLPINSGYTSNFSLAPQEKLPVPASAALFEKFLYGSAFAFITRLRVYVYVHVRASALIYIIYIGIN